MIIKLASNLTLINANNFDSSAFYCFHITCFCQQVQFLIHFFIFNQSLIVTKKLPTSKHFCQLCFQLKARKASSTLLDYCYAAHTMGISIT